METKQVNALDLFAGAGGFSLGMQESGINVIAAIEIDEKISKTYRENHPSTTLINDDIQNVPSTKFEKEHGNFSNTVSIEEIFKKKNKNIDIVFGGPPCQGFSMAGRRIRRKESFFEDDRNLLFLEFLRMVKNLNPKVFVIENVPGILNYDNGRVKDEIESRFAQLGYDIESKILSAEKYGVPQKRSRAIFIGNNVGIKSSSLFPNETHNQDNLVTVWDAICDLPSLASGEGKELSTYSSPSSNNYQNLMRNTTSGYFYNHLASKHKDSTINILRMIAQGETMKDLPENIRTKSIHSGAYGRMKENDVSYTLTTRLNTPSVGRITHPRDDRTITPREAARIQSFPDNYNFIGDITTIGIQIGNSVPPLLAKAIGRSINAKLFSEKFQ